MARLNRVLPLADGATARWSFVFLAHYVESWNLLLNRASARELHEDPARANKWRWKVWWPFYFVLSIVYLLGRRAYNRVDEFRYFGIRGATWLLRNVGWHFAGPLLKWFAKKLIRHRILAAVRAAQRAGYQVIGLGALTKAEGLTKGGQWVVDQLQGELTSWMVHGDTLTAAVVIRQVFALINQLGLGTSPVFLIGATSKIGRAVALSLIGAGLRVRMYSEKPERVAEIRREAGEHGALLEHAASLRDGQECRLWITGKHIPPGKVLVKALPKNAVVLNFSVPDPLSPALLKRRPDVLHLDGGLVAYDPAVTSLQFTMRLPPGITYACHAGTIVHAHCGWQRHEVGPVEMNQLDAVWTEAVGLGFSLPHPTSFLRPVTLPSVVSPPIHDPGSPVRSAAA